MYQNVSEMSKSGKYFDKSELESKDMLDLSLGVQKLVYMPEEQAEETAYPKAKATPYSKCDNCLTAWWTVNLTIEAFSSQKIESFSKVMKDIFIAKGNEKQAIWEIQKEHYQLLHTWVLYNWRNKFHVMASVTEQAFHEPIKKPVMFPCLTSTVGLRTFKSMGLR